MKARHGQKKIVKRKNIYICAFSMLISISVTNKINFKPIIFTLTRIITLKLKKNIFYFISVIIMLSKLQSCIISFQTEILIAKKLTFSC